MELGKDYLTVFDGREGEFPAVEWKKDSITLYGWSGSVAQVLLDGIVVLSRGLGTRKCSRDDLNLSGCLGRRTEGKEESSTIHQGHES